MSVHSVASTQETRVILVRHGRSTFNEQGRYQGASDESILTVQGWEMAYQTGLALQDQGIDAFYTSPLQRAQQSAEAILSRVSQSPLARRIPRYIHQDLKEIDLPEWAGLPYQQVRETFPQAYQRWLHEPHQFEMRSQQPVQDLYAQAQRFWQDVLPAHRGQTLVVVSHGGTIRALISTALGISSEYYHTLQQSNCGISILRFGAPFDTTQLEVLNDTRHLGEQLPKIKAGRQGLRLVMVPASLDSTESQVAFKPILQSVDIDFSVSNGDVAHGITQALLSQHPRAVQFQTNRTDLSELWLRTLNHRRSESPDGKMMTGLLVAQPHLLHQMLGQIMGLDDHREVALSLLAGRASIVHFPTSQPKPIVQALNFAELSLAQRGLLSCAS